MPAWSPPSSPLPFFQELGFSDPSDAIFGVATAILRFQVQEAELTAEQARTEQQLADLAQAEESARRLNTASSSGRKGQKQLEALRAKVRKVSAGVGIDPLGDEQEWLAPSLVAPSPSGLLEEISRWQMLLQAMHESCTTALAEARRNVCHQEDEYQRLLDLRRPAGEADGPQVPGGMQAGARLAHRFLSESFLRDGYLLQNDHEAFLNSKVCPDWARDVELRCMKVDQSSVVDGVSADEEGSARVHPWRRGAAKRPPPCKPDAALALEESTLEEATVAAPPLVEAVASRPDDVVALTLVEVAVLEPVQPVVLEPEAAVAPKPIEVAVLRTVASAVLQPVEPAAAKPIETAAPESVETAAQKLGLVATPNLVHVAPPKPTKVVASNPGGSAAQKLGLVAAPKPAHVAPPMLATFVPKPGGSGAPKLVEASAPQEVDVAAPKPVKAKPSKQDKAIAPKIVEVAAPKRAKSAENKPVAAPKPVEVAPKPVEVVAPRPVEVVAPKPVEVAARRPVGVAARKPVEVAAPKLVEVAAPKSVGVAAPKPVGVAAPQPDEVAVGPRSSGMEAGQAGAELGWLARVEPSEKLFDFAIEEEEGDEYFNPRGSDAISQDEGGRGGYLWQRCARAFAAESLCEAATDTAEVAPELEKLETVAALGAPVGADGGGKAGLLLAGSEPAPGKVAQSCPGNAEVPTLGDPAVAVQAQASAGNVGTAGSTGNVGTAGSTANAPVRRPELAKLPKASVAESDDAAAAAAARFLARASNRGFPVAVAPPGRVSAPSSAAGGARAADVVAQVPSVAGGARAADVAAQVPAGGTTTAAASPSLVASSSPTLAGGAEAAVVDAPALLGTTTPAASPLLAASSSPTIAGSTEAAVVDAPALLGAAAPSTPPAACSLSAADVGGSETAAGSSRSCSSATSTPSSASCEPFVLGGGSSSASCEPCTVATDACTDTDGAIVEAVAVAASSGVGAPSEGADAKAEATPPKGEEETHGVAQAVAASAPPSPEPEPEDVRCAECGASAPPWRLACPSCRAWRPDLRGAAELAEAYLEDCPAEFVCPISMQLMRRPCTTSDGRLYDWASVEEWLAKHNTSPLTNVKVTKELTDDRAMGRRLERWLDSLAGRSSTSPCADRVEPYVWKAGVIPPEDDWSFGIFGKQDPRSPSEALNGGAGAEDEDWAGWLRRPTAA